ncbi:MAG: 4Fe-4S dicluster domain-containing protein [Armatimonadetes bacterium]|nr:4Fe-4S dicluster domain-containing protein [Armatimonadota bacterium]
MRLSVDAERCTLCGLCIETCPSDMIRRRDDRIRIGRIACLECGHCLIVCPTDAITDERADAKRPPLQEACSPGDLGALIRRRRTVRRYRPDPVPQELLECCLDAARWTPTAANCQAQEYIVLTDPDAREDLQRGIEAHYRAFAEALADKENRSERLKALGLDPAAAAHPHVLAAVPAFVKAVDAGRDRLFFGAPAVVIVHASEGAVMPEAACAFAALTFVLMAESHQLGTCVTGFAADALRARAGLRQAIGVPEGHQVHYVVVVGWPHEPFRAVPNRKPARITWR